MKTAILSLLGKSEVKTVVKIIAPTLYHRFKAYLNRLLNKLDSRITKEWDDYAGGAVDSTLDPRDIQFSEVVASDEKSIKLPSKFTMQNGVVLNQGRTNRCVAYGSTEGGNEANSFFKNKRKVIDPEVVTDYIRANLDPKIDERGTWIYNWPKALQQMGEIHSYTQVNGIENMKKSLYLGCPIATGTNKLSWSKTGQGGAVAVLGAGGGHFMNIIGYDDDLVRSDVNGKAYTGFFIVENTWGISWGDKGSYYLPYELVDQVLFNTKKSMLVDRDYTSKRAKSLVENIEKKLEDLKPKGDNKYFYLLKPYIEEGYEPIFNDHFEKGTLNAGEIKTLIELRDARKWRKEK